MTSDIQIISVITPFDQNWLNLRRKFRYLRSNFPFLAPIDILRENKSKKYEINFKFCYCSTYSPIIIIPEYPYFPDECSVLENFSDSETFEFSFLISSLFLHLCLSHQFCGKYGGDVVDRLLKRLLELSSDLLNEGTELWQKFGNFFLIWRKSELSELVESILYGRMLFRK